MSSCRLCACARLRAAWDLQLAPSRAAQSAALLTVLTATAALCYCVVQQLGLQSMPALRCVHAEQAESRPQWAHLWQQLCWVVGFRVHHCR